MEISGPALQSLLGLVAQPAFAWAVSEDRRRASWKVAAGGLAVQLALAVILLELPYSRDVFMVLNRAILALERATGAGTSFVFGYLGGGNPPFEVSAPASSFILAFRALPLILVVSALSALLFHWRVLPIVVRGFAWALRRTMGVGGAVGVSTAANIFIGMIEAPLLVRPYLERMTRAELFIVMTGGMATVAGTVMVLYASILGPVIPDALANILIASIISAPAAITIARLMIPGAGERTEGDMLAGDEAGGTTMEAIVEGTTRGIALLINVTAMLVVMVALVALVNEVLALLPDLGGAPVTLQRILAYVLWPLAWVIGIPAGEALVAAELLGTKTVINELVAYVQLAGLPEGALSPRSRLILVYAMCGFANFGSLGIVIAGLATMVPARRAEIVGMGLKTIVAGTLATCMTGAIVGLFNP